MNLRPSGSVTSLISPESVPSLAATALMVMVSPAFRPPRSARLSPALRSAPGPAISKAQCFTLPLSSFNVEIEIGVRIDPLHLGDNARDRKRLIEIEFRLHRMMGPGGHPGHQETDNREESTSCALHRFPLVIK